MKHQNALDTKLRDLEYLLLTGQYVDVVPLWWAQGDPVVRAWSGSWKAGRCAQSALSEGTGLLSHELRVAVESGKVWLYDCPGKDDLTQTRVVIRTESGYFVRSAQWAKEQR